MLLDDYDDNVDNDVNADADVDDAEFFYTYIYFLQENGGEIKLFLCIFLHKTYGLFNCHFNKPINPSQSSRKI